MAQLDNLDDSSQTLASHRKCYAVRVRSCQHFM